MRDLKVFVVLLLVATATAAAPAQEAGPTPPPGPAATKVVPHAVVVGPTEREAFRAIVMDGRQSTTIAPLAWKLVSYSPDATVDHPANPSLLIFDQQGIKRAFGVILDPQPGEYDVAATASGTDNDGDGHPDIDVEITRVRVTPRAAPTPAPTPSPNPPHVGPPPSPPPVAPIARPFYATLFYDMTNMDPATASIRGDAAVRPAIEALGGHWRTYEVHSPDMHRYHFDDWLAKAGGAPALLVQDATGKVAGQMTRPGASAAVLDYVRSLVVPPTTTTAPAAPRGRVRVEIDVLPNGRLQVNPIPEGVR